MGAVTFREYFEQQHPTVPVENFGINDDDVREIMLRFFNTLADYLEQELPSP